MNITQIAVGGTAVLSFLILSFRFVPRCWHGIKAMVRFGDEILPEVNRLPESIERMEAASTAAVLASERVMQALADHMKNEEILAAEDRIVVKGIVTQLANGEIRFDRIENTLENMKNFQQRLETGETKVAARVVEIAPLDIHQEVPQEAQEAPDVGT